MTRRILARLLVVLPVLIASAAVARMALTEIQRDRAMQFKKGDPDAAPGTHKQALIGPGDDRSTDYSPAVESYLLRAYPEAEVPGDATLAAIEGWGRLNAGSHAPGSWQLIGPSKATYPAALNPFLFDGAQYVTSGRVTAMAIAPTCTAARCTLYVAAAGGGVWRTDKALNGSNWQFTSGSFGTNAIGSLLID